ncbi:RNA polymerase sigma factor [Nonomuraea rhizosphaerae]|uniref:RNA polymerase sigma factor n=1 Tax=Nonomuraea rhizosphaerae TaxID=2665663 RepID=UPI001C5CF409|nr:hypothetical protein [Nonomuraea rhizosphaerae]
MIAELYDRHAAGLFAYCADQLGDHGSATDTLVTVLTSVPVHRPPRAALYAFARREIQRRDVVYASPSVDPLIDPASALVERTLRELRPHQREVLVLVAVCGLDRTELAWALDVAPDTAEELATSAAQHYRQTLDAALACTSARVSKPVADVYGALGVAPLRDVLGRLPWPSPPLGEQFSPRTARARGTASPMFVKPRWPVSPTWPLPLGRPNFATSTGIFPTELLTPPSPSRVAPHEATTAPMPKLRDPLGTGQDVSALEQLFDRTDRTDRMDRPERAGGKGFGGRRFFTMRPAGAGRPASGDILSDEPRRPSDAPRPADGPRPSDGPRHAAEPRPAGGPAGETRSPLDGQPSSGSPLDGRPRRTAGGRPRREGLFRLPQPGDPVSDEPPVIPSDEPSPFRRASDGPLPRGLSWERPFTMPAPVKAPEPAPGTPTAAEMRELATPPAVPSVPFPSPIPADVLDDEPTQELPAIGDVLVAKGPPREPSQAGEPGQDREPGAFFTPKSARKEPVYRMPPATVPFPPSVDDLPIVEDDLPAMDDFPEAPEPPPEMHPRPAGERHYDWAWELAGFLVCVAIAMIVFFAVPLIIGP